ncbi:uncharacterized protein N0V89_006055 [Didymosphaeria variabile]|uniref:Uncharacterized protein n=1 Tax=Didymosphaeria variabile TaxID=1932322 RepID=A0A9W9CBU8_9PLEO|nr:uncharacterized protein N0V89_006055 [Didymosphaeria variabile]KAJ4354320.1 hypothetical protein N0V89_006055 [Didymosphaeria variabile]
MASETTSHATHSDAAPSNNEPVNDATVTDAEFSWSVPLQISSDSATYLDRHQTIDDQELSIPREDIAEVVGGSRLVAELKRPIQIGTFNELPAYLLRTHFSFQRASSNWLYRIRAAEITIVFEDAPTKEPIVKLSRNKQQHPAIAAFHPTLFEGEVSHALVTESVNAGLEATQFGVGATLGTERSKTYLEKGRVVVHGVRGGGRHRNSITWVVEQDSVEKSGIPRDIKLPLIVTRQNNNRFSARVTVKAHYGFWRGALARSVPVVGKNEEPLYFDPATLEDMIKDGTRGPDGTPVVELCEKFDEADLKSCSSFP